jgi:hypothetical protein
VAGGALKPGGGWRVALKPGGGRRVARSSRVAGGGHVGGEVGRGEVARGDGRPAILVGGQPIARADSQVRLAMSGSGNMTLGDYLPFIIGAGIVIVAVVAFLIVRSSRRGT